VHGEDQRVAARIVVEYRLGRRVRENATVPVELAVDADRRKRRRQRARGQDVLGLDLGLATIEVVHHAGPHMGGADHQARLVAVDESEIDELGKRLAQRRRRIVTRRIGPQRDVGAEERRRIRLEEAGNSAGHGRPCRKGIRQPRQRRRDAPEGVALDAPPDRSSRCATAFPAMMAALIAPMDVPMIQSGSTFASCRAS
jgi:hypothetical protein